MHFGQWKRREFITLLGGAAAWPLAAWAQQPILPVVAFFNVGSPDARRDRVDAFRKGLSETGYTEGRNVLVEYYWLEGNYEGIRAVLDDVIRRGVAVIAVPGSTPVSVAAKAATETIPIVFGVAQNPVELGLVKSLAQPGGNATGINFFNIETDAKRLGLMHELLPKAARFGVLVNPANVRYTEATSKSLREAARATGVDIVFFNASTPAEIDAAFAAIARERVQALFIAGEAIFASRSVQLATLTARDRIPASFTSREMVEIGLLMSYGTSLVDMARQVGVYTGTILKGAKPTDLPVMQPTRFELVINLKTAKALGLEVPPTLLARADDVIE
jgi:putative ABC transport system substrate-binding protein